MNSSEELSEISRSEDILLGAMGFSEDARLKRVVVKREEVFLEGSFTSDGETFVSKFDGEFGPLESWALEILKAAGRVEIDN